MEKNMEKWWEIIEDDGKMMGNIDGKMMTGKAEGKVSENIGEENHDKLMAKSWEKYEN